MHRNSVLDLQTHVTKVLSNYNFKLWTSLLHSRLTLFQGWNCFGKICGDYVFACENDENVAIKVLYNFLSASIEAVSAPERRMRMHAIADEIEENIDFEEDEKE